ncbi:InlB B-repeat-containing protein [Arundinibacter roseus]|uniref:Bacterial repeat domain-containing protein n=1 Tax=Arundinibacter roseus TaxID=2070510 RepID=A0A4R4JYV2_9BACT|nr:hypothetical protein [Arundinibacter roseus]TDB60018.1 hypothetical protein EZE20_21330 [Arundinibacter roseus]
MRNSLLLFLLLSIVFSCKEKEITLYTLKIDVTPMGGGTVTPLAGEFEKDKQVQITATAAPEYIFKEWQGAVNGSTNPVIVTMTGDKQLMAVFEKRKYPLTVTVEGEGIVQEKVLKNGRTTTDYPSGTVVELTAVAAEEWLFSHWDADTASKANPREITISTPQAVKAVFVKRKYPLTVTVEGEGIVQEKVLKSGRTTTDYPSGTVVELTAIPAEGWLFRHWNSDTSQTKNPQVVTVNKPETIQAVFKKDEPIGMDVSGLDQDLIISHEYPITVKLIYESGKKVEVPTDSFVVNYVAGDGIAIRNKLNFLAIKRGNLTLRFTSGKLSKQVFLRVSEIDDVSQFDEFLKTPAAGASVEIPVVVINFLPTIDGYNLDMMRAPDDYWTLRNSTLAEAKQRIMGELKLTKFGIEEGTRFRQFTSNARVKPYAGIKVVKYFNVYEVELVQWVNNQKTIDYKTLFAKLNMKDLVNNQGVKEVWFTIFPKDAYPSVVNSPYNDPNTYYGMPESNMSSPLTGDISNSYRISTDLPVYEHTYVVYGNSGHRGFDTNLHNRGHQIEAQLSYIEKRTDNPAPNFELFYNKFVGVNPKMGNRPLHRAGMTHFPPNTFVDYDYDNPKFLESDIHTWQPYGGEFIMVNNAYWKNVVYTFDLKNTFYQNGLKVVNDYTNDAHSKWLMYWWQAIPGEGNSISFDGRPLTNWWDVFYNWDDAIRANRGLTKGAGSGRTSAKTWSVPKVNQPECDLYPKPKNK